MTDSTKLDLPIELYLLNHNSLTGGGLRLEDLNEIFLFLQDSIA